MREESAELVSNLTRMNVAKEGWTVYYVDGVNGNDSADGLKWSTAFKTISHAIEEAESWAKIYIKSGTYAEEVTVDKDNIQLLAAKQWITIQPGADKKPLVVNADQCVIKNIFADAGPSPTNTGAIEIYGNLNQLINCKVSNGDMQQGIRIDGDKNYVYNLETSTTIGTIVLFYGTENEFVSCSFNGDETSDYGFAIQSGSNKNKIHDCEFSNFNKVDAEAIRLFSNCSYNMIFHNNFIDNNTHIVNYGTATFVVENFYSDHSNVDNGCGIATEPYSFTGGQDPRPVVTRNGWLGIAIQRRILRKNYYSYETGSATTYNGTSWVDIFSKTVTRDTKLTGIKITNSGTFAGTPQYRILVDDEKVFPYGDANNIESGTLLEFDYPISVPLGSTYKVQVRSTSSSDTSQTATLNELDIIELV